MHAKISTMPRLKLRSISTNKLSSDTTADLENGPPQTTPKPPLTLEPRRRRRSNTNHVALSQTLASTAYLSNLLPTGTLLAFHLLTPVFTNNGVCHAGDLTYPLTLSLLLLLAASSFAARFTDSFRSHLDGRLYYGLVTPSGMWLFDSPHDKSLIPDLSAYRLRLLDWLHAALSAAVFAVVALRDANVVGCLYPQPSRQTRQMLEIVPVGVGTLCGLLFVAFPTRRHGVGYPVPGTVDDQ